MELQWPPQGDDAQLLEQLGGLIARAGAAHLLDGPIARADSKDFPERWEKTRACVERLIHRLFWLAHVDLEVELEDLRTGHYDPNKLLVRSSISWVETRQGVAHFLLEEIGNDNVAGLLCHEVGRAFAAWVAGAVPYREAALEPPTEREGTIAAVYLGLGVVATNAAQYHRAAGEQRGRQVVTQWEVVVTGGLSPRQLLILLAAQVVLRGGELEVAHHSLREDLLAQLRLLVAQLRPHREALAALLGIELEAPRVALEREPAPATVTDAERPEPSRELRYKGHLVTLTRVRRTWLGFALGLLLAFGWGLGVVALDVALGLAPATRAVLLGGGGLLLLLTFTLSGRSSYSMLCSGCKAQTPPELTTCASCGATILSDEQMARHREEQDALFEAEFEAAEAERLAAEQASRRVRKRRAG